MASRTVQLLLRELQKFPQIDPHAELAVAAQEGLGGGVGDNGTSFGPNQLHAGGALPAAVWARGPAYAQQWAWSPAGIDYALSRIAKVAGGKRGAAAVDAIVTGFERPADPATEVSRALAVYHGTPSGGTVDGAVKKSARATPAAAAAAGVDPAALAIYEANLRTLGVPALAPLMQLALSGAAPSTPAAARQPSPVGSTATSSPSRFATVPADLATRAGILVDPAIDKNVIQLAQRFGVKVNSGYRSPQHNAAVGGATNSDHLRGDAVDFTGTPQQIAALYTYAQGRYPYVEPMSQAHDHVHISFRRP